MGPLSTICAVSTQAARKVPRLKATLTSRALSRWPTSARTKPPANGVARRKANASISVFLQLFEVANVQAVELFANLEHEHAQDQHANQHIQRDAELDHHRHAIGRRCGSKEQAVLHCEEADDLRNRLCARDHHQER